ncbi:MAG: helix-turn-helix transcriptional regulator [Chitinophagaceae bacterium]|nr:helix-turn-helix transcriptional regulator [Chitinophagaceae bacterium]
MLSYNLEPIFKARGIDKPYTFMVKAGISPSSSHAILNNNTRSFRLDHIELLCRVLICEPNDLLVFTPDPDKPLPPNHPLNILRETEQQTAFKETLFTIPFKQLKEITKQIGSGS